MTIDIGELKTRVTFYEYVPNEGPEPGESERRIIYRCWAKVNEVWMKDLEQAKSNGTAEDLTVTIRDPQRDYTPINKHYVSVDARGYQGKRYNIKHVRPDLQNNQFITIIAGVVK